MDFFCLSVSPGFPPFCWVRHSSTFARFCTQPRLIFRARICDEGRWQTTGPHSGHSGTSAHRVRRGLHRPLAKWAFLAPPVRGGQVLYHPPPHFYNPCYGQRLRSQTSYPSHSYVQSCPDLPLGQFRAEQPLGRWLSRPSSSSKAESCEPFLLKRRRVCFAKDSALAGPCGRF
jgi:hypothetical protein